MYAKCSSFVEEQLCKRNIFIVFVNKFCPLIGRIFCILTFFPDNQVADFFTVTLNTLFLHNLFLREHLWILFEMFVVWSLLPPSPLFLLGVLGATSRTAAAGATHAMQWHYSPPHLWMQTSAEACQWRVVVVSLWFHAYLTARCQTSRVSQAMPFSCLYST